MKLASCRARLAWRAPLLSVVATIVLFAPTALAEPNADSTVSDDEEKMPPTGYLPGHVEREGIGLSPHVPGMQSALPGGLTPSVGAPLRPDEGTKFDFHGYLQAGGRVVRAEAGNVLRSTLPDAADLSATALEEGGALWAASLGKLWMQPSPGANWESVWKDPRWTVPLISLYADGRRVLGVAADGGMIEGLSG